VASATAHGALQDEIQVYLDDIDRPGRPGLELHVNATPDGNPMPAYPGEVVSRHGLRMTPEFSYGLAPQWEAGLYLPVVVDDHAHPNLAGLKLRLKWLPLAAEPASGGWFAGGNIELARVGQRYERARDTSELRLIAGRRTERWVIGVNPVFDWALAGPERSATPDFNAGFKAARRVAEGASLGAEYYVDVGPLSHRLPPSEQDHRLYLAFDLDRRPCVFNLGLGYGLTAAADKWTIKAIVEVPLSAGGDSAR
jgi:hypothetical protein